MKKRSSLSLNQDHREDEQEAEAGLRNKLKFKKRVDADKEY